MNRKTLLVTVQLFFTLVLMPSLVWSKQLNQTAPIHAKPNIKEQTQSTSDRPELGSSAAYVPQTSPMCEGDDMGGFYTTNQVSVCCAYTEDAEGRSVCKGYETCSVKSINCLDMDTHDYYTVNGDPFNCTRDAACDEPSEGTTQIESIESF